MDRLSAADSARWQAAAAASAAASTLATDQRVGPAEAASLLVAAARAQPGKLNYGQGSSGNLLPSATLVKRLGLDVARVNYRSPPQAMAEVLSGQVQFMFTTIPPALPHVKTGKLKALCVANAKRSSILPDLPTTAEAGAPVVNTDEGPKPEFTDIETDHVLMRYTLTRAARAADGEIVSADSMQIYRHLDLGLNHCRSVWHRTSAGHTPHSGTWLPSLVASS